MTHREFFHPLYIQVHITPERVEIMNPGKLLFPKEELGKRSAQRNPLLTDMVHRLGMVEKAGSGIKRMRKLMKEYDLELDFEIGSFFSTVFHRNLHGKSDANPSQIGRKTDANWTQAGHGSDAKARCDWILDYLVENKTIRSSDIINRLDIVKDTAIRDLNNLIRQNKIVKKGGGNNVWYELPYE